MALTNLSQITTSGIATGTDLNIRNITGVAATFTGNVTVGGTLTYDDVTNIDSVGLITARGGINVTGGNVKIGTTTEGNANADNLTVADSANSGITIRSGSSNIGSIFFSDATSGGGEYAGFMDYNHSSNQMSFGTAETTRVTITSDGEVLISNSTNRFLSLDRTNASSGSGEFNVNVESNSQATISYDDGSQIVIGTSSSPRSQAGFSEKLRITSAGFVGISNVSPELQSSAARNLVIGTPGSGGQNGLTICSNTSGTNNIYFGDASSGQGESMGRIVYSHADDSLRLHTVIEERLRISSAGNIGIGTVNVVAKVDVVTGTGDGTQNEANCLRLRNRAINGNAMTLQVGVNTAAAGALNQGYAYLQGRFWGGGNNPILLNPKGGNVGIGRTSAHVSLDVNGDTILRTEGHTTQGDLTRKYGFTGPNAASTPHSYIAGVADQQYWYQGFGLVFGTVRGNDIGGTLGVERMRISSDGKVGIGTISPTHSLTSFGSGNSGGVRIENTHNTTTVSGNTASTAFPHNLLLTNYESQVAGSANRMASLGFDIPTPSGVHANATIAFQATNTSGNGDLQFWIEQNNTPLERLRITSSGFIGAGTANPRRHFHLHNSATATVGFQMTNGGTGESNDSQGFQLKVASDGHAEIAQMENSNIRIFTNAAEKVRITSTGYIGIGTAGNTVPTAPLSIKVGSSGEYLQDFRGTSTKQWGFYYDQGNWLESTFRIDEFDNNGTATSRLTITSGGKVGINVTSPSYKLHVKETTSASNYVYVQNTTTGNAGVRFKNSQGDFLIFVSPDLRIYDYVNNVDRLRISNNGRIGINADPTTYANSDTALGLLIRNGSSGNDHVYLDLQNEASESGRIRFVDGDNGIGGQIYFSHNTNRDGVGANCMGFFTGNNNLRFSVTTTGAKVIGNTDGVLELDTSDGRGTFIRYQENGTTKVWAGCSQGIGSGGNEEDFGIRATRDIRFRAGTQTNMRLTAAGYLQVASDSDVTGDNEHIFRQHQTTYNVLQLRAETSSYAASGGGALAVGVIRSASSSYVFGGWYSGNNSSNFQDRKFSFRGDGQGYADGNWNSGGADYAEYFEWSDGNTSSEDRRGISVVLDGDKIREATSGEDPIGVISANPSVVGDADDLQWKNKYLRTEYGSFDLDENGEQKLNPDYNPNQEYVSRENRPEWDTVGLMGKLRIRKGQITGSRWIKMRDVSANVEEWLVR